MYEEYTDDDNQKSVDATYYGKEGNHVIIVDIELFEICHRDCESKITHALCLLKSLVWSVRIV